MPRSGPETLFRRSLSKELRSLGLWIVTTHGGPFSAGLPDLIGSLGTVSDGRLLGLELKARRVSDVDKAVGIQTGVRSAYERRTLDAGPKPVPTVLQVTILKEIHAAGGLALVAVKLVGRGRDQLYEVWRVVDGGFEPVGIASRIPELAQEILRLGGV